MPPRVNARGLKSENLASDVPPMRLEQPRSQRRRHIVKIAIRKATEVVVVTAGLYRELTHSALRLVTGAR